MNSRRENRVPREPTESAPSVSPPISVRPTRAARLWLFRILALLVIPALFLGSIELILRAVGFGYDPAFVRETTVNGRRVYTRNLDFPRRFFPSGLNRNPEPFEIPMEKPAGAYRVFVLGASAAQGVPEPSYSFSRILDVLLRERHPGVDFEVINCAATAINSHVVLEIASDLADLAPDLFVIYMGNNEVVGPFGPGTVLTPFSPSRTAIRAGLTLRATRLGQGVESLLKAVAGRRGPRRWEGMRMFLNQQVRADAPELDTAYGFFEANLREIYSVATGGGAAVIACTVGANLRDCPPFASQHRGDLSESQLTQWTDLYQRGIEREQASDAAEAIELYRAAAAIDETFAELRYRLARCLEAVGQFDEAAAHYRAALQFDTLRFRADERINQTIRTVAEDFANRGVRLVDAERMFIEHAPHGVPDGELFHEHVHMTFRGNYLLALSILERMPEVLPERILHAAAATMEKPPLSEAECAARLAHTQWDARRVREKLLNAYIKQPPFTNQSYHTETVRRLDRELAASDISRDSAALRECDGVYRAAIERRPADARLHLNYAQFLLATSADGNAIETQLRYCREHLPADSGWFNALAVALMERGDNARAEEFARRALEIAPDNPGLHMNRAELLLRLGRLPEAFEEFSRAIELDPADPAPYLNRGLASQRSGDLDAAFADWRQALELEPDDAAAHMILANVLTSQGKPEEALEHYRAILRVEPENTGALVNAGVLLRSQGDVAKSLEYFQSAVKCDPDNARTLYQCGLTLKEAGRHSEALENFRRAAELDPAWAAPVIEYAWLRATSDAAALRDPAEAIASIERLCRDGDCDNAKLLDVLAVAYAAVGRFDDAVAATRRAIRYTSPAEPREFAERQRRLHLYETKQAYQPATNGNPQFRDCAADRAYGVYYLSYGARGAADFSPRG